MNKISFTGKIRQIKTTLLLPIPLEHSTAFSTRGMLMIEGRLENTSLHCPIEPDGKGSHWLKIDSSILHRLKLKAGDMVYTEIWESEKWYAPALPDDIYSALSENDLLGIWETLTHRAKWEWLRWINATANLSTRTKRIAIAIEKLYNGDKRPCCFNSRMCSDVSVSKAGVLKEGDMGD